MTFTKESARDAQRRSMEVRRRNVEQASTEQNQQGTDEGARVEEQFRREPEETPVRRKSGRPRGRPAKPRTDRLTAPGPEPIAPEEAEFWGRQFQSLLNTVGESRGYPPVDDELKTRIGEPAALVARKRLPKSDENPELVLLMVLLPWLGACARVELERWKASADARRTQARGTAAARTQRDLRSDAERQDLAGEEFITRPFTGPGS